jgi:hypothetical protein
MAALRKVIEDDELASALAALALKTNHSGPPQGAARKERTISR